MAAEVDVIQHLLDVEYEASITLLDAQKEADRKIAASPLSPPPSAQLPMAQPSNVKPVAFTLTVYL